MNIKNLILIPTESCNFNCKYCFVTRENKQMEWQTAREALFFFLLMPTSFKEYHLFFTGGEPLLNYALIERAVDFMERKNRVMDKKGNYALTTNGSLLTDDILGFLNHHHFTLELSFDGLAQDIGREPGTFESTKKLIKKIRQYPNLSLVVNGVFTPDTINLLSASLQLYLASDIPRFNLSISRTMPWPDEKIELAEQQLDKVGELLVDHFRKHGRDPMNYFKKKDDGQWYCSAARSSMTVTAQGEVWGCYLFYEHFKNHPHSEYLPKFSFGSLDQFTGNYQQKYPEIAANYSQFCMKKFITADKKCRDCELVNDCSSCPPDHGHQNRPFNKIENYICRLNEIDIRAREKFREKIKTSFGPGRGDALS